ncbi:MAG TPA: hypothetical protein VFK70_17180 [Vicinamibacteria bacterium]|nr:hypothetical protein [Vicinamibacteria bacterium]
MRSLLVVFGLTAIACGDHTVVPDTLDVSGTWNLIVTAAPSCAAVLPDGRRVGRGWLLRLQQSRDEVAGTVEASESGPTGGSRRIGAVNGTVSGSHFTLTGDMLDPVNDPQIRVAGTLAGEVCGSGNCATGTIAGVFGLQPSGAPMVGCEATDHSFLMQRGR